MTIINQKSISGITSITFASAGDDLLTFHSNNGTERFRIDNSGNTKITAGIVTTLTTTGNATVGGTLGVTGETTFSTHVNLGDSDQLRFGASNDLVIQHNGSDSLISETGTGDLYIRGSNNIYLQKGDGSETFIATNDDGAVELYHDNVKKIDTVTGGQRIFGYLSMQGTGGHIYLPDSAELKLGDSEDLKIYHDASNSRIKNTTGSLWLQSDTGIRFTDADVNESMAAFYDNGAVELYYDGTKRFETKSDGVDIIGELQCDTLDVDGNVDFDGSKITFDSGGNVLKWADNVAAYFGTGDDLRIYHDGSNSYIDDAGTGNLKLNGNEVHILSNDNSEYSGRFISNGAVELYHDGNKKFETLNNGVRAQGGILFGSDTANANALSDYEEGTWTPAPVNFDGTITINSADYVKVGRLVHINMYISFSNTVDTSNVLIGGLPFTVAEQDNHYSLLTAHSNGNIPDLAMRAQGTTTQLTAVYLNNSDGDAKPNYNHVRGQFIICGGTYYST